MADWLDDGCGGLERGCAGVEEGGGCEKEVGTSCQKISSETVNDYRSFLQKSFTLECIAAFVLRKTTPTIIV